MGAIQSAMNQAINSGAIAAAAGKEISADVKKKKAETNKTNAETEKTKAATEQIKKSIQAYGGPQAYSAGANAYNLDKGILALMNVDFNKAGKTAQQSNFQQKLEASKGVIKASRKTIGGKK